MYCLETKVSYVCEAIASQTHCILGCGRNGSYPRLRTDRRKLELDPAR